MKILIFGGNGYIGGECVKYLLDRDHDITLLNRDHWPWDGAKRIRSRVKQIYCDRHENPDKCLELKIALNDNRYDAIIDFSATDVKKVEPFYDLFRDRVGVYIYISSDSCYEVCEKSHCAASREEHAVRPKDSRLRAELADADQYGNGKLEVEEFLQRKRKNEDGIPYVFLRLPDVLGERDTTDRWWKYQMWMEYQNELQAIIYVPTSVEKLYTSYVDVVDVGDILQTILTSKTPIQDEIFNIASHQPMTLIDLLNVIKNAGEYFEAKIKISEKDFVSPFISHASTGALKIGGDFYFPSVTRGPIDIEKIQTKLNWRSSCDFLSRAKEIAQFYKIAWKEFPAERKTVGESLLADLGKRITEENREQFITLLNS